MADSGIAPNPDSNQPSGTVYSGTLGTDLGTVAISEVYRDLLTINDSTNNNAGATDALKYIRDGAGFPLPIQISKTEVSVEGDLRVNDLHIGNTINLDSIDQYLFNVETGTTGTVFKLRVGNADVFAITNKGEVNVRSLDFEETNENDVSGQSEGTVLWNGTSLLCYL
jgi:hypothetical protein